PVARAAPHRPPGHCGSSSGRGRSTEKMATAVATGGARTTPGSGRNDVVRHRGTGGEGPGRTWSLRREWSRAFTIMLMLLGVAGGSPIVRGSPLGDGTAAPP